MNLWPLTGFTVGAVVLAGVVTVLAFVFAPADPGPMEGDE
jgi:hypothetical protein